MTSTVSQTKMNFLSEVINCADKIELDTIHKKIPELIKSVDNLKIDVLSYIEKIYVFSSHSYQSNLLSDAKTLTVEAENMKKVVNNFINKQMKETSHQIREYANDLEKTELTLTTLSKIMEIHECLAKVKSLQAEKLYVEAIQTIKHILENIVTLPELENLEVMLEFTACAKDECLILVHKLSKICQDNVICTESQQDLPCYTLKLKKVNDEMNQALLALSLYEKLSLYESAISPLNKLTRFLWDCVFTPIVNCKTSVNISEEDDMYCLEIITENTGGKDPYKNVLEKLCNTLTFLHDNFNYELQKGTTLTYMGEDLKQNLSELIIKNCLADTIPSNEEDLQSYSEVINEVSKLQDKLKECCIFNENETSLLDYANNIDILFINKKCKDYMHLARSLMRKDLHDMIQVGTPHDPNNILSESSTSDFPQSYISKSTLEILDLAENILQTAINTSDVSAGRLYCIIQNIFNIYGVEVYEHHQRLIQTIPQQTALYYNNCKYIAHKLLLWSETYKNQLPNVLDVNLMSLKDQAITLQQIANQKFQGFVEAQRQQLGEILKESGLKGISSLEKLKDNTEKCIRQCLRQQELLKTVWQKVLPYYTYNKTIGSIMNYLCEYIINSVNNIDDIASDAAEQLVDLCKLIISRGSKLFTDPNEVCLYVEKWNQLQELQLVLNSSLLDIYDRWADGKGPLALLFQAEEVKKLIRALFQNTDRRAAILSKIH